MTTTEQPLNLDAIQAKAAELRERLDQKNPWPSDNEAHWMAKGWKHGTRNALDKLHTDELVAEVCRLRAERNRYRNAWHNARARAADAEDNTKFTEEQPTGTCQCGHDDYHDPHEWADRPDVWCPGHVVPNPPYDLPDGDWQ